jgi:hypothetical protein
VPTFSGIPFAGWTLVTAGVAAYAARIQGSRPYAPIESGQRAAQYRTACWRLILILLPQDCHRTRPGCERRREGLLHTLARERGRFRKRRCRASTLPLQRSSWNQVNGALRADDIVHEAEGMRSNATAAYSRTPCLRDHRMRHGERILVVEDSLPAGRNDRRFAARLRLEPAGPAGWRRTSTGPTTRDRRRGFVLRSPRQNGLPTTIMGEERFAADVRLHCSHRAWRDKRRTPLPRPVPGPGRRSG